MTENIVPVPVVGAGLALPDAGAASSAPTVWQPPHQDDALDGRSGSSKQRPYIEGQERA